MASISLEHIRKTYEDGVTVIPDLNLEIRDREFLILVGPSGCGKSTTLRMIAGLEDISGGTLKIGDRVVNDLPPKDRDIAMVFQNYALYPHMTVYKNMAFGLQLRRVPKAEIDRKVRTAAQALELTAYLVGAPAPCPADSGSGWRWVALWCGIRRCFFWTSPYLIWMPSCVRKCAHALQSCTGNWVPLLCM